MHSTYRSVVENVLDTLGYSELNGYLKVICNNRLRSCSGLAKINIFKNDTGMNFRKRVEVHYSPHIFAHMKQEEILNTLTHEACHLCNRYEHGRTAKPHGKEWKSMMIRMGENPSRCHKVDVHKLGISKKGKRYRLYCGCEGGVVVGPTVYKRIEKGIAYACKKCRKRIAVRPNQSRSPFDEMLSLMGEK